MIRTVSEEEHNQDIDNLLTWYEKKLRPYAQNTELENVLRDIKSLFEELDNGGK